MERTQLGPLEQFCDDSGACHIGQRLFDSGAWHLRGRNNQDLIAFCLYATGDIVLVDPTRLDPNVPNPPAVVVDFGTSDDEPANCGLTEIDLVDPGDN